LKADDSDVINDTVESPTIKISEGAKGCIMDTLEELIGTIEDIQADDTNFVNKTKNSKFKNKYSDFLEVGKLVINLLY